MDYKFCPKLRTAIVKYTRLIEGVLNGLVFLSRVVEAGAVRDDMVRTPFPARGQLKISPMSLHAIFKFYAKTLALYPEFLRSFQEHAAEAALENIGFLSTKTGTDVVVRYG
jgi:hypothetical protein